MRSFIIFSLVRPSVWALATVVIMSCIAGASVDGQSSPPERSTYLPRPLTERVAAYHGAILSASDDEQTLLNIWAENHATDHRSINQEHWPPLRQRAQELAAFRVTAETIDEYHRLSRDFADMHHQLVEQLKTLDERYLELASALAGPERIAGADLIRLDLLRRRSNLVSGNCLPTNADLVELLERVVPNWTMNAELVAIANRYVREATPILQRRTEETFERMQQGAIDRRQMLLNSKGQPYDLENPDDAEELNRARHAFTMQRRDRYRADLPLLKLHRVLLPQILLHIDDDELSERFEMRYHQQGYPRFGSVIFDLRPFLRQFKSGDRLSEEQVDGIESVLHTFNTDFRDILRRMEQAEDEFRHDSFENPEGIRHPMSDTPQARELDRLHERRVSLAMSTFDKLASIVPRELLDKDPEYRGARASVERYTWHY